MVNQGEGKWFSVCITMYFVHKFCNIMWTSESLILGILSQTGIVKVMLIHGDKFALIKTIV